MVRAHAERGIGIGRRQRTHPGRRLQLPLEEGDHLRALPGRQILGESRAHDVEVVAVPHRDEAPVRVAGRPVAAALDIEFLHRIDEAVGPESQIRRLVVATVQVKGVGRHPQAPHIGRIERGNLVLVGAHAFEQVVDVRAVVGEGVPRAQALPGCGPALEVVDDRSRLRLAACQLGVEEVAVAGPPHVLAHHARHRVVVDRVPVADPAAGLPFGAEVGVDVGLTQCSMCRRIVVGSSRAWTNELML